VKQPTSASHPFNIEAPSHALVVDDSLLRAHPLMGLPSQPTPCPYCRPRVWGAPSHHYLSSLIHKPVSSLSIEVITLLLPLLEGLAFRVLVGSKSRN